MWIHNALYEVIKCKMTNVNPQPLMAVRGAENTLLWILVGGLNNAAQYTTIHENGI